MKLKELGEFGLIDRFAKKLKFDSSVVVGPGDDCAVLKLDNKRYELLTCDMIVEGVDFTAKQNPYLVGRKAVAVSISDIAACCGIPTHCVISMGIPKKDAVTYLGRVLDGMRDLARAYKVNIVGGDISAADKLTIDVAMRGVVEKKNLVLRSGARDRDIIFVTGPLGGSIREKHLKFTPRLKEARYLTQNFKVNSMIDISDGLAQDLGHITDRSKVGAYLYESLIPVSKDARGLDDALYSGEDFELLFTLSREEGWRLLRRLSHLAKPVGEIVKGNGIKLIDKKGKEILIRQKGYRHF